MAEFRRLSDAAFRASAAARTALHQEWQALPGQCRVRRHRPGLPLADDSCDAVYCSHVLEHLALEDFRVALRNTHRVLKHDGVFRLVLPDLYQCASSYLASSAPDAASAFLREACLGQEKRPRSLRDLAVSLWGNSPHLWMWDYKSIVPELERAGFVAVRRASFGDSADDMFRRVEDQARWDDCLGVECRKAVAPRAPE